MKRPYQPKTGQPCHCKPGQHRDNCPDCEGTGWRIDFARIRAATAHLRTPAPLAGFDISPSSHWCNRPASDVPE